MRVDRSMTAFLMAILFYLVPHIVVVQAQGRYPYMFNTLMPLTWAEDANDGANQASAVFPSSNSITSRNATVCSTFIFSQQQFTSSDSVYLTFMLNVANINAPTRPLEVGLGMPGNSTNNWDLEFGFLFINGNVYAMSLDPVAQTPVVVLLGVFNSSSQYLITYLNNGTFSWFIKNPSVNLNSPVYTSIQNPMTQMPMGVMIEMCDRSYLTNIDYGVFNPIGTQLAYNDACPCQNGGTCVPQLQAPYYTCVCAQSQYLTELTNGIGADLSTASTTAFYGTLCNYTYLNAGVNGYQCPLGWNNFPLCDVPVLPRTPALLCSRLYSSASNTFTPAVTGFYNVSLWGGAGGAGGSSGYAIGGAGAYMMVSVNMTYGHVYRFTSGKAGSTNTPGESLGASCVPNIAGCGGKAPSTPSTTCGIGSGGQHSVLYVNNGTSITMIANAAGGGGAADCTYTGGGAYPGVNGFPNVTHGGTPCILTASSISIVSGAGVVGSSSAPVPYGGGGGGCSGGNASSPAGSFYDPTSATLLNSGYYDTGNIVYVNYPGSHASNGNVVPTCAGGHDPMLEYWNLLNTGNLYPGCPGSQPAAGAAFISYYSQITVTMSTTSQSYSINSISSCPLGVTQCNPGSNMVLSGSTCACAPNTFDFCLYAYCSDLSTPSVDCNYNGDCIVNPLNGTCNCYPGYYGAGCEQVNTCITNNTCVSPFVCQNTSSSVAYNYDLGYSVVTGTQICSCPDGYYGNICQYENTCLVNQPCQNEGVCANTLNTNTYTCTCVNGFTGTNCEIQPLMFTSLMPLTWDEAYQDGANKASVIFPDATSITSRNSTVCSAFAFSEQSFTSSTSVYLSFMVNVANNNAPYRPLQVGLGMPNITVAEWKLQFGFQFSGGLVYAMSVNSVTGQPALTNLGLFYSFMQYIIIWSSLDSSFHYHIKPPQYSLNSTNLVFKSPQNEMTQMPMSVMVEMCDKSYLTNIDYGLFYKYGAQLYYNGACPCQNGGTCVPQLTSPYFTCICSATEELFIYNGPGIDSGFYGSLCQNAYLNAGVYGYQCPLGWNNYPVCDFPSIPQYPQSVCGIARGGSTAVSTFTVPQNGTYNISLWGAPGGAGYLLPGGNGAYISISMFMRQGDVYKIDAGPTGVSGSLGATETHTCAAGYGGCGGDSGPSISTCGTGAGGQHSALYYINGSNLVLIASAGGGSGGSDCTSNSPYYNPSYLGGVSAFPNITTGGNACILSNKTISSASGAGTNGNAALGYGGGGGGCSGGNGTSPAGSYYLSSVAQLISAQYTTGYETLIDGYIYTPCVGGSDPVIQSLFPPPGCSAVGTLSSGAAYINPANPNITLSISTTYQGFYIKSGTCLGSGINCPTNQLWATSFYNIGTSCQLQANYYDIVQGAQYCYDPGTLGSGYMSADCTSQGTCVVTAFAGTCYCATGYFGIACEFSDPCTLNPGMLCSAPYICRNTSSFYTGGGSSPFVSGYECDCPDGYYGSSCQYENTCLVSQPCQNAGQCNSVLNSAAYTCTCFNGYTGPNCQTPPPYSSSQTPFSSSLTPFSSSLAPFSSSLAPFSSSQTPYSSSQTPASSSLTPFSSSLTPFSSSQTPFSSSQTPASSSLTPFSSSQTPFSSSLTPFSSSQTPYSSSQTPVSSSLTPFSSSLTPASSSSSSTISVTQVTYTHIHITCI